MRDQLDLLRFTPFRLNRLAAEFSQAFVADYTRFGIDIPEWHVLAILGQQAQARSARYVVTCTRTHKSRISRAVAHLMEMGLVARREDRGGGRELMLTLTDAGQELYRQLVPTLLQRQASIMSCLTEAEAETFGHLLAKIEAEFSLVRCDA